MSKNLVSTINLLDAKRSHFKLLSQKKYSLRVTHNGEPAFPISKENIHKQRIEWLKAWCQLA